MFIVLTIGLLHAYFVCCVFMSLIEDPFSAAVSVFFTDLVMFVCVRYR